VSWPWNSDHEHTGSETPKKPDWAQKHETRASEASVQQGHSAGLAGGLGGLGGTRP